MIRTEILKSDSSGFKCWVYGVLDGLMGLVIQSLYASVFSSVKKG